MNHIKELLGVLLMMLHNNCFQDSFLLENNIVISVKDEQKCVDEGMFEYIEHIGAFYKYNLLCSHEVLINRFPNVLHYLDCFWLILPKLIIERRIFWKEFYNLYSNIYDKLVDSDHNINCICHFKNILEKRKLYSPNSLIFDFGCGIGLSSHVFDNKHLFGYDSNALMEAKAEKCGLKIISRNQFQNIAEDSFDICIACYVFHLSIDEYEIVKLTNIIKRGGAIIANFYKGIEEERINQIISNCDLKIERVEYLNGKYGSIYVYRK